MRIEKYLDKLQQALAVKTDKEVIAKLGWSTGTVSNWRKGRAFMTNQTAAQVSEILSVPVIEIIAAVEADREEVTGQKSFWTAFFQRTAGSPAVPAVIALASIGVTKFVTAPTLQASLDAILWVKDCVLC